MSRIGRRLQRLFCRGSWDEESDMREEKLQQIQREIQELEREMKLKQKEMKRKEKEREKKLEDKRKQKEKKRREQEEEEREELTRGSLQFYRSSRTKRLELENPWELEVQRSRAREIEDVLERERLYEERPGKRSTKPSERQRRYAVQDTSMFLEGQADLVDQIRSTLLDLTELEQKQQRADFERRKRTLDNIQSEVDQLKELAMNLQNKYSVQQEDVTKVRADLKVRQLEDIEFMVKETKPQEQRSTMDGFKKDSETNVGEQSDEKQHVYLNISELKREVELIKSEAELKFKFGARSTKHQEQLEIKAETAMLSRSEKSRQDKCPDERQEERPEERPEERERDLMRQIREMERKIEEKHELDLRREKEKWKEEMKKQKEKYRLKFQKIFRTEKEENRTRREHERAEEMKQQGESELLQENLRREHERLQELQRIKELQEKEEELERERKLIEEKQGEREAELREMMRKLKGERETASTRMKEEWKQKEQEVTSRLHEMERKVMEEDEERIKKIRSQTKRFETERRLVEEPRRELQSEHMKNREKQKEKELLREPANHQQETKRLRKKKEKQAGEEVKEAQNKKENINEKEESNNKKLLDQNVLQPDPDSSPKDPTVITSRPLVPTPDPTGLKPHQSLDSRSVRPKRDAAQGKAENVKLNLSSDATRHETRQCPGPPAALGTPPPPEERVSAETGAEKEPERNVPQVIKEKQKNGSCCEDAASGKKKKCEDRSKRMKEEWKQKEQEVTSRLHEMERKVMEEDEERIKKMRRQTKTFETERRLVEEPRREVQSEARLRRKKEKTIEEKERRRKEKRSKVEEEVEEKKSEIKELKEKMTVTDSYMEKEKEKEVKEKEEERMMVEERESKMEGAQTPEMKMRRRRSEEKVETEIIKEEERRREKRQEHMKNQEKQKEKELLREPANHQQETKRLRKKKEKQAGEEVKKVQNKKENINNIKKEQKEEKNKKLLDQNVLQPDPDSSPKDPTVINSRPLVPTPDPTGHKPHQSLDSRSVRPERDAAQGKAENVKLNLSSDATRHETRQCPGPPAALGTPPPPEERVSAETGAEKEPARNVPQVIKEKQKNGSCCEDAASGKKKKCEDRSTPGLVVEWVSQKIKERYQRKIKKSLRREQLHGNKFYVINTNGFWFEKVQVAEFEQKKRKQLQKNEQRCQGIQNFIRKWEEQRATKKAEKEERKKEKNMNKKELQQPGSTSPGPGEALTPSPDLTKDECVGSDPDPPKCKARLIYVRPVHPSPEPTRDGSRSRLDLPPVT